MLAQFQFHLCISSIKTLCCFFRVWSWGATETRRSMTKTDIQWISINALFFWYWTEKKHSFLNQYGNNIKRNPINRFANDIFFILYLLNIIVFMFFYFGLCVVGTGMHGHMNTHTHTHSQRTPYVQYNKIHRKSSVHVK